MAKEKFPYVRWYPADFDEDEDVQVMTDEQVGFYLRLLNYAWRNQGLPSDVALLIQIFHKSRRDFDRLWKVVGKKFVLDSNNERYTNKRQEKERTHAHSKSESATNSVRTRYERTYERSAKAGTNEPTNEPTNVEQTNNERDTDDLPRALSVLNSQVSILSSPEGGLGETRFPRWWGVWSAVRGTNHPGQAAQAWLSIDGDKFGEAVFDCTQSYLASLENPANGYNPENFLFDQAKDHFRARFPARASPRRSSKSEQGLVDFRERMAKRLERSSGAEPSKIQRIGTI